MQEEDLVLEVQVFNKVLLLVFLFFLFGAGRKILIQRAIVAEHNAIVYQQADFDAEQIALLPRNKIIAVSTKIYRPKNLFGSFYKIYVNKPRKIRGYISEIDVVPQYKQVQEGLVLNSAYRDKEAVLKQVQERSKIQRYKKRRRALTEELRSSDSPSLKKAVIHQQPTEPVSKNTLVQPQKELSQKAEQERDVVLDVETKNIHKKVQ